MTVTSKSENDVISVGRIGGNWPLEIIKTPFTRLIDAVSSGMKSDDAEYRARATGFMKYGEFSQHNTSYFQQFADELPALAMTIARASGLEAPTVSVIKQMPGQIIPWHQDQYYQLKKSIGVEAMKNRTVFRYLVFLEDWKTGHYFQAGQTPHVQWKAGDVVTFRPDIYHLSANVGLEPKYTMQITGLDTETAWLNGPRSSKPLAEFFAEVLS